MKDIAIDENGHFIKKGYGFTLTSSVIQYVIQKIRIRLLTFLGEWFLDTTVGLPYKQIQEKNPNIKLVTALMKEKIATVDGVKNIESFQATYDNKTRTFKPTFKVSTTSGETGTGGI